MYFLMLTVSVMLVMVVSILFFMISYKKLLDGETYSSYECGFNPKSITRMFFSFRFFLVTILFLIFDVEIVMMLPLPYLMLGINEMLIIYIFFTILVVGLVYEYYYGSLNW
uniref:NADH-ubiquinone oxidoreductase chain 3 n=1 Tax=Araneus ventricosus TaxID=182803 RepID=A0A0U1XM18_ARAVE|nr:NADH dehydrogenase subunit 3 [Araneus ventricosus]AIU45752.1 NADH dehydrogenase subunit 3 [Araneus ventricosus]